MCLAQLYYLESYTLVAMLGLNRLFVYMGGGLIFAVLFRVTKSIYWPIGLHIVYNGIGQILMLL